MPSKMNLEELEELKKPLPIPEGLVKYCLDKLSCVKAGYGWKDEKGWFYRCTECGEVTRSDRRLINGQCVKCSSCGAELDFHKTDKVRYYDSGCGTIDFIENYKGKLLLRRFKYEKVIYSTRDQFLFQIYESGRIIEGNTYQLTGSGFRYKEAVNHIAVKSGKFKVCKRINLTSTEIYEPEKGYNQRILDSLGLKYCCYDLFYLKSERLIIDYVNLYRDRPKIELLVKGGYHYIAMSARQLNMKGKNFEQIFGIPSYWDPYVKRGSISINDVRFIKKHKIKTYEQLMSAKDIRCRGVDKYVDPSVLMAERFLNYYSDSTKFLYADYLRWCKKLGYPMDDYRVLCPKNLKVAHDKMQKEYQKLESDIKQKEFDKVVKNLEKYNYEGDEYIIRPARSQLELIQESEKLHHCVRTYADRMAMGDTAIFFLRDKKNPETPLYTIEFKGKCVTQFRGDHNCSPDDTAKEFVKLWVKKVVKNPKGYQV
ncbi:PcfJ domain-containing protein [Holdemania massiliensis]|uniref:PcfJ domain-containing protein n=1 Tax=Holdemania massiliensis TaxID=1468449 RepID=UPI00356133FA